MRPAASKRKGGIPGSGTPPAGRAASPKHWQPGEVSYPGGITGSRTGIGLHGRAGCTDNEGDRLTPQGAADAEKIGRDLLHPPYAAFVSTGAARATRMLEILRHAAGQDDIPITPATGLRSSAEDRWREAARAAGKGADLDATRAIYPDLVRRRALLPAPPPRAEPAARPQ